MKALKIRHINSMKVRKKRPRGFKKRPRGVQVSPLNPLSVSAMGKLLPSVLREHVFNQGRPPHKLRVYRAVAVRLVD